MASAVPSPSNLPMRVPEGYTLWVHVALCLTTLPNPYASPCPQANLWFDRGMVWTMGFHHEEAIACFTRALAADPQCVMAHWGIAYCHGPNYNVHHGNGYYTVLPVPPHP